MNTYGGNGYERKAQQVTSTYRWQNLGERKQEPDDTLTDGNTSVNREHGLARSATNLPGSTRGVPIPSYKQHDGAGGTGQRA